MKRINNLALGIFLSLIVFCGMASAEGAKKDAGGVFLGIDMGASFLNYTYAGANLGAELVDLFTGSAPPDSTIGGKGSIPLFSVGITLGWRDTFVAGLGYKVYGQYSYLTGSGKHKVNFKLQTSSESHDWTYEASGYNSSINVDLFYDLYLTQNFVISPFIGIGLGHMAMNIKTSIKSMKVEGGTTYKKPLKATGFHLPLNAGFSFIIANNHNIELLSRIPLLPLTIEKLEITKDSDQTRAAKPKSSAFKAFNVLLGYSYKF